MSDAFVEHGIREILRDLQSLPPTRERALAITKLQEALLWVLVGMGRIVVENQ